MDMHGGAVYSQSIVPYCQYIIIIIVPYNIVGCGCTFGNAEWNWWSGVFYIQIQVW